MNFAQFSFWWILLSVGLPILGIRWLGQRLGYWPRLGDAIALLIISLILFWQASPPSWLIFVGELLFNYAMVRWMQSRPRSQAKWIGGCAIAIDLGILIYFKYRHFFWQDVLGWASMDSARTVTDPSGASSLAGTTFLGRSVGSFGQLLPPGISFYTFQMVAFVVDSWRMQQPEPQQSEQGSAQSPVSAHSSASALATVSPPISAVDYFNFASFFPQIIAGPIERRDQLMPQIQGFQFRFSPENLEYGLRWLVLGLFMKLVLADNLAPYIYADAIANPWLVWLSIGLFGLRIYFDFAGYSFIALGIAKVLGVNLSINFLAPYAAHNVQDFWRRWHITLSTWFRDYVYIPLGGSNTPWVGLNVLIVFGLSGLWHGAGWNFILWGLYHGILLLFYRVCRTFIQLPRLLAWLLTFSTVMLGWLFFMEPRIDRIWQKLNTLTHLSAYSPVQFRAAIMTLDTSGLSALALTLGLAVGVLVLEQLAVRYKADTPYQPLVQYWTARGLAILTILLAASAAPQFIYFQF